MHKRLVDEILMLEDMNSKKSIKQVADILGITEKTVRTDIKEIDTFLQIKQLGQIRNILLIAMALLCLQI